MTFLYCKVPENVLLAPFEVIGNIAGVGSPGTEHFWLSTPCQFECKVQSLNRISGGKVSKKGKGPGMVFAN